MSNNRESDIPREVLDDMFATLEASRKLPPASTEQKLTESAAELGVRGYRNGYRNGWNDALQALLKAARHAVSDSSEYQEIVNSAEALKKP